MRARGKFFISPAQDQIEGEAGAAMRLRPTKGEPIDVRYENGRLVLVYAGDAAAQTTGGQNESNHSVR